MDAETVREAPVIGFGVPLAWQISGLGDLNNDGRIDLVWRHTQTGDVSAWLMDGAAIRQLTVIASGVPLEWHIEKVVDVDGDAKADLVWRRYSVPGLFMFGEVTVWLMDGAAIRQLLVVRTITGFPKWQIQ